MANVTVFSGKYRNIDIRNSTFHLVQDVREGTKGMYITVKDNGSHNKLFYSFNPKLKYVGLSL